MEDENSLSFDSSDEEMQSVIGEEEEDALLNGDENENGSPDTEGQVQSGADVLNANGQDNGEANNDTNTGTSSDNRKRRFQDAMETGGDENAGAQPRSANPARKIKITRRAKKIQDMKLGLRTLMKDYEATKAEIVVLEDAVGALPDDLDFKKRLMDMKLRKIRITHEFEVAKLDIEKLENERLYEVQGNKSGKNPINGDSRQIDFLKAKQNRYVKSNEIVPDDSADVQRPKPRETSTRSGTNDENPLMIALAKALMSVANDKQENETHVKRAKLHRDLPYFNGAPSDWPNFIAQFRESTETCGFTDSDNIVRLQKALKDKAREAVLPYLINSDNMVTVLDTLERRFGRPQMVIDSLLDKAREIQRVDDKNLGALVPFSCAIDNLVVTMENLDCVGHMANPSLLNEFVEKLPQSLMLDWAKHARLDFNPNLRTFAAWLGEQADAASTLPVKFQTPTDEKQKPRSRQVNFKPTEDNDDTKPTCSYCREKGHKLWECETFQNLTTDERWTFVRSKKMCFVCLVRGHQSKTCTRDQLCGINGCNMKHHRLLHSEKRPASNSNSGTNTKPTYVQVNSKQILMKVLPVTLISDTCMIDTYAYLDSGGSSSLIDDDLAKKLKLDGNFDPLTLEWTNSITKTHKESKRVTLKLKGMKTDDVFEISEVRTIRNLNLPMQTLNYAKLSEQYPHLDGLPVVSYANANPMILLGQEDANLIAPDTVIRGPEKTPVAWETPLGWCISGPYDDYSLIRNRLDVNFLQINKPDDQYLHELVKRSFAIDDIGIKVTPKLEAVEDEKALALMKKYTSFDGKRWTVPVLFKDSEPKLPENRSQALMRLHSMERKMKVDEKFAKAYECKITDYLTKGYASVLDETTDLLEGKTWILPHFAVVNPNKPGKIRFVMDAASRHKGVGLNDVLLKGPDLMTPLIRVLLNFRRYRVAISGDIREMFHQVMIRPEDRCSQLFMWHDAADPKQKVLLKMDRMIFGSISSPFCAQYVKNVNAERFKIDFPEAVEVIQEHHYVDDCLASVIDEDKAIRFIKEVTHVHDKGGFEIVGWTSNSAKVVASIPDGSRGIDLKTFDSDDALTERTLGLQWSVKTDEFTFKCTFNKVKSTIFDKDHIPTKRQMLQLIMSLYDPLGFIGHFVVKSKIILQDVWRTATGWDEPIDSRLLIRWKRWLDILPMIEKVRLPRCMSPEIPTAKKLEIHVFNDASGQAYGTVAYLVITKQNDEKQVTFLMSKSKVAPLKPLSIPRMELQAGLIGARLAQTIKKSLKLTIDEVHFWTDSWTVMCWIRSETRRFQQFVSHRVGEILESTDAIQWRWVPTELNPADKLTREESPVDTKISSQWYSGPSFLRFDADKWPKEPEIKPKLDQKVLEVRGEPMMIIRETNKLIDFQKFSSYQKTLKVMAYILKFIRKIKKRHMAMIDLNTDAASRNDIGVNDINLAETVLIHIAQKESYPEEVQLLKSGHSIAASSKILKLCPRVTGGGITILKISGRLDPGKFDDQTCSPIILDGSHPLAQLIVKNEHEKGYHIHQERLVNLIRQKFWITGLRNLVKKTFRSCSICKYLRSQPKPQIMGNLPDGRQDAFLKPFSNTGLDYFGPIMVRAGRGRSPLKRYGCLFTCMTTRAVHLEVANDLSTDSCLMAIRRMMARRGQIKTIYSDQGRNFVGANRDLQNALSNLDHDELMKQALGHKIDWRFNPPGSPHMGGAWESLIKSVKTALEAVTFNQRLTDESLITFLTEIEWIMNSRPLTHVSVDPNDPEALTPNHFLIGSAGGLSNWENWDNVRLNLRQKWKQSQQLANQFWRRWMQEYVPILNLRNKWFTQNDNFKPGDVVLITDENMPRNMWPKGVVIEVYPGQDGIVRVADVKTKIGIFRRPITKLCNLKFVETPSVPTGGGNGCDGD